MVIKMKENIKQFNCKGKNCENHCCGAFDGISKKLNPLGGDFTKIILLPGEAEKIKNAGRNDLIEIMSNGMGVMKTDENGLCHGLVDGRCEIYEHRPAICKAFPLYLDMFAGICYVNECGAFRGDIPKEDYRDALDNLLDIYQFWIDYYKK